MKFSSNMHSDRSHWDTWISSIVYIEIQFLNINIAFYILWIFNRSLRFEYYSNFYIPIVWLAMTKGEMETSFLSFLSLFFSNVLRVIFSECRESEDSHERSIFLLFFQNIPLSELIQGKIV